MRALVAALLLVGMTQAMAIAGETVPIGLGEMRGGLSSAGRFEPDAASMRLRLTRQAPGAAVVSPAASGLRGAVEGALHDSPAVRAAGLEARAAEVGVWRSLAEFLPSIEAGYDRTLAFDPGGTSASLDDTGEYLSLTATVPLFSGGQRYHRLAAARADADAARFDAISAGDEITGQVLDAWMRLAAANKAVDVFAAGRERVGALQAAVAARVRKGFASPDQLALAGADLAAIEQSLALAEARREMARNAIGRHAGHLPRGEATLPSLERHLGGGRAWLLEAAHRRNPELRAASARYRSQRATARAALGANLPQVTLTGQARYDLRPSEPAAGRESWRVGLNVRVPIVNARNWTNSVEQKLLSEAALAREADALRTTEQRIGDLWANYTAGTKVIAALRRQAQDRQKAALAAKRRFTKGFGDLEAAVLREREAQDAALALIEAEATHQATIARLLLVAGLFDTFMLTAR